jgi:hypothetical protein
MFADVHLKARQFADRSRQYRMGEPSGMLVAIAQVARLTEALAARIERWARRPATIELPRIPAR